MSKNHETIVLKRKDNSTINNKAVGICTIIPKKTQTVPDISSVAEELVLLADFDVYKGQQYLVCFVCTGNTCRSPMAAAWLNHLEAEKIKADTNSERTPKCGIERREIRRKAISAGLAPMPGVPISQNARVALRNSGVESNSENPWEEHRSQRINADIMKKCDIIIGISGTHAMALMTEFPEYAEKIFSMPHDISDPYGGDIDIYKTCLKAIQSGIQEFFN